MRPHICHESVAEATTAEPHADHGRRYGPNRADHRALHASARSNGRRVVRQGPWLLKPHRPRRPPAPPPLPRCHRSQTCRTDSSNDGENSDAR